MRRVLFVTLVVLLGCAAGWAQTGTLGPAQATDQAIEPGAQKAAPEWGTTSLTVAVVSSVECSTFLQATTWSYILGSPKRYITSAGGVFECGLHLPAGASIEAIELEGCDTSASGNLYGWLVKERDAGSGEVIDTVDSGVTATPGCGWFQHTLPTPYTVNNFHETYWFQVQTAPYDGTTSLTAARVYYKLQVSPAPSTATFADVPTSSTFFKYVEALYASGLIAGCGGGNYCPNNPVTRGQMAVYLAGALGMHWPY